MAAPRSVPALVLAAVLGLAAAAGRADDGRRLVRLDGGWRFTAADDAAAIPSAFDDQGWPPVTLPHTWNARDGEDGGNDYRRGAGWYRRHLVPDKSFAGRQLYLVFDGASLAADVYVNGAHLGRHEGGFARFVLDATAALRIGADNVIAVRVDNRDLGIPPTDADFTVCGGLYRGVWLLATDPIQVSATDLGSAGLFLEPRAVTAERAQVMVRAEIENHSALPGDVEVGLVVTDAARAPVPVGDVGFRLHLDGHARSEVVKLITVDHPHLWNGRRDPYLYRVRLELRPVQAGGAPGPVADAVEQPLGLRFFALDPARGFLLNGAPLDLHGFNRHQDRIDKGWAISDADEAEDFGFVLESGATAMRLAHYQQSESWYRRCDEAGIVVWAEIPNWGRGRDTVVYLQSAQAQLRELIRQNFNHPSICFWGFGNETEGPAADRIAAALAPVAREEDPSRLSTYASDHPAGDPRNWHGDAVGFNRYYGWYGGDLGDFPRWLDETRAAYPQGRWGLSEYGAGASIHQHADAPGRPEARGPFHPEEYQNLYHEAYWAALRERPYVWGKFVWALFDFASDGRNEGDQPGRNDKGLVTYDRRVRKDAFYFYKANWSDQPVLHITSAGFTPRSVAATAVKVYANAAAVSLTLNGAPLGTRADPAGRRVFEWAGVTLRPGANTIRATAEKDGVRLSDQCLWTLGPP